MSGTVAIEIAPGELIDKITILEIKSARIEDSAKLANIRVELENLARARDQSIQPSAEITRLTTALSEINKILWDIENEIRGCERRQDFGPGFIELARSVYLNNDRRAALKKQINLVLGSDLTEEKSYQ